MTQTEMLKNRGEVHRNFRKASKAAFTARAIGVHQAYEFTVKSFGTQNSNNKIAQHGSMPVLFCSEKRAMERKATMP